MYVLRGTNKLLQRLGDPIPEPARSSTRLGDWYANTLRLGRTQLILCVSERSLLPVVIPAREVAQLPTRLPLAIAEVLAAIGVAPETIGAELAEMSACQVAKTASRQILGSMNDFAGMLEAHLASGDSLLEASVLMARAPCSPIGMERPRDRARELLSGPRLRLVE